ncbi:MAG: hypothetical protein ING77_13985, partial [Rhodocyclaceae bacterium]|nr:hypothetical protein [Rhodocyclaceae bacterium]
MSMLRRALVMCVLALPCAASANVPEGVDAFGKSRFADARKVLAAPAEAGEAQAMAYMGEML